MQHIIDICDSRVAINALRGPYAKDVNESSLALCIDGTSATRKTTVLERTTLPVRKVQRFTTVCNSNTYYPSMIGYIAAGINQQNTGKGPHLNDRSYLNTLEWNILWRIMDDYVTRQGNTDPLDSATTTATANEEEEKNERYELMEGYRQAFRDLAASYHYRALRRKFRAIAFIDSNVTRCDEIRMRRNVGTDRERSLWQFYTPLQNLMYETLYPDAHIDLAWFDDIEQQEAEDGDLVINALAVWINRLVQRLSASSSPPPITPHCPFHLPLVDAKRDYTLRNMEVHVYRSFGRLATRKIAHQYYSEIEDDDEASTYYEPDLRINLASIIPDYVEIENIPEMLYDDTVLDDSAYHNEETILQKRRRLDTEEESMKIPVEEVMEEKPLAVASLNESIDSMFE
nr:GrBNV_gp44-like protein [Apis mellifera nudivirus]